jgi:hypothetical protein
MHMSNLVHDKLDEREYYHGTSCCKALQIFFEGFRLKKDCSNWGSRGTYKQAIYLTKSLYTATLFGGVIFKCRMVDGASVLRIDKHYDPKVIDSLRREFGKDILTKDLSKVIPSNKHLTRKELINLLNYRYVQWDTLSDWESSISSIRQHLRFHKYDAIGDTVSLVGLAVFNPSFVKPIQVYTGYNRDNKGYLNEFDKAKFAYEVTDFISDMKEWGLKPKEQEKWNGIRSLLERYCKENGLRTGKS